MKKFLFSFLIFCTPFILSAQTIFIMDGNPIDACDGIFTDSGDLMSNYNSNENLTTTICPTNAGTTIELFFSNLDLASGDTLCFFDGNNVMSALLGCFHEMSNNSFVIKGTAANSSGCVTVTFQSDATNEGGGWEAELNCAAPCQIFNAEILSATPSINPPDTGFIDLCLGDTFSLSATADFFQNDIIYNQTNSNSLFQWDMGDGNILTGENISYAYAQPGGYHVRLQITDNMGCVNGNILEQRVRVTGVNNFNIENILTSGNCEGDTITLIAQADVPTTLYFSDPLVNIVNFPIPDGTGAAYTSTMLVNAFPAGSTFNNVMDLIGICVKMEHSWMRDLEIKLTCPSGSSIILHDFAGNTGGEVFLGEPNINDENIPVPIPGIGYDYCFSMNTANGTFIEFANNTTVGTLPSGTYDAFDDFSNLLGCPLNGEWEISIIDNWAVDNGFLFSWELNFGGNISPNQESFSVNIANQGWLPSSSIISNSGDTIEVQMDATETFTYQVVFDSGCTIDTTFQQVVIPSSTPACFDCNNLIADAGSDVFFTCPEIVLDASNSTTGDFFEYEWTTTDGDIIGATDGLSIFALQPGEYIFTQTSTLTGCIVSDTIQVLPTTNTPIADGGGNIPLPCGASEVMLDGTNSTSGSDFTISWFTNDGVILSGENTLTPVVQVGTYILQIDNLVSGCSHTDVVTVEEEVINNITITDATCDAADGAISLEIPSGTANPNFAWSTGATGNSIQDLAQGWYSVTVTYNDTCSLHENIFVDEDLSCKVKISGIVMNDNVAPDCMEDGMTERESEIMVHLMPADIFTYTNFNGYYEFVVDNGDYTIEVILPSYLENICPADGMIAVSLPSNGMSSTGNNFYTKYIQGAFDLSASCFMSAARPGMEHVYYVNYCNDGDVPKSGTVSFTHDMQETNISTISTPQGWNYDEATSTVTWTFANLQPGACLTQTITLDIPTTILAGEILSGSLEITSTTGDDFEPNNNSKSWNQAVTASFDPNDKQVFTASSENQFGGMFFETDTTFAYQIRFQNTGNDTAFTVVIRDTLDAALDVTTIRPGISSHPYQLEFEGNNILIFNFENIMLPDSNTNLAASQGFATFTIDRRLDLPFGSTISNSAAIYFDYNEPVITNQVVSILTEPVSVNRLEKNAPLLEIYPNPNQGVFTIFYQLKKGSKVGFSIIDMHGRDVVKVRENEIQQAGNYSKDISIDNLPSGIYFVQIKTEHGNVVKRFVKAY